MRFFKKWLENRAIKAREWEPATSEQLRKNVRESCINQIAAYKASLADQLHSNPPEHPGDLFYTFEILSQYRLELAMLDWRSGHDPTARLAGIKSSFDLAVAARPDMLNTQRQAGFLTAICVIMGWQLALDTEPPADEKAKFPILYLDQWMKAGLADPSFWSKRAIAPKTKNQFVQKCLDDYWALLTDQIDPDEGMQRCIANYERRATHQTFKAVSGYHGGGAYNELFVDYTLAAILKKRGLQSGSIHDWIWD